MPDALRILLTSQSEPKIAEAFGREMIDALDSKLREAFGGACVGTRIPGGVIGEISGVEWVSVGPLLAVYASFFEQRIPDARLVISKAKSSLLESGRALGHALSTEPKKLTKTFFLALPSGAFLVSNVLGCDHRPVFAESVADGARRVIQWERITELRVGQRQCRVFGSQEKFLEWEADMRMLSRR